MRAAGGVVTIVLLLGVALTVFAFMWLQQKAMWDLWGTLLPELRSDDPAKRRAARIGLTLVLVMVVAIVVWLAVYDPIPFPKRR